MSSMQSALGLAQLERIAELVERKRQNFFWYREELYGWNQVSLNADISGLFNSYWMPTVVLDSKLGITKEMVVPRMLERGIDVRPFFYPLSMIPAFRDTPEAARARRRNKIAQSLSPRGINLPSALNLERTSVSQVCKALKEVIGNLTN